jgi:hypothetical protein
MRKPGEHGSSVHGSATICLSSDAWVSSVISSVLFQHWRRAFGKKNSMNYSLNRSDTQRRSSGHAAERQRSSGHAAERQEPGVSAVSFTPIS